MTETADDIEPSSRKRGNLLRRLGRYLLRREETPTALVEEALREREDRGEAMGEAHKDMILRAARFDRLRVSDVMQPRADIVGVEASATLGEAARAFSESQHSRLPIYGETLDDPMGFVHVRDVMAMIAPGDEGEARAKFSDRLLPRIKRDILFVPASMTLSTLFLKMQSSRIHLALVVDEYGGTDGLVSMEDLVEQIVGDIADEHDVDAALIQERAGALEADGRAAIDQLEARLGASLAIEDNDSEFDTAAGLAVALAGRVPQRGEILHHPGGFDLEIIDADPRRVKRVRIKTAMSGADEATGAPAAEAEKLRARKA